MQLLLTSFLCDATVFQHSICSFNISLFILESIDFLDVFLHYKLHYNFNLNTFLSIWNFLNLSLFIEYIKDRFNILKYINFKEHIFNA